MAQASLALVALFLSTVAVAADSAVVLEYHHVAEDTPPSTSVTPETFERHMEYLAANGFEVWPLPRLVAAVRAGKDIPERTIALTFDDGYRSVYEEVFPRLQARGWPFTIFIATDSIDDGDRNFVTWDQLREMEAAGVTIGNHSVNHPHMIRRLKGEDQAAWLRRLRGEIVEAQERLDQELKRPARLFAYPFGEFSPAVARIVRELDFVGFGQQSGAVGSDSEFSALPRFPIATAFAGMESFAIKVRSRPLPVTATRPDSGVLEPGDDRPGLRLTLGPGPYRPEAIRCYLGGDTVPLELETGNPPRLSLRPARPLQPGRSKVNCTAPATDGEQWFWYSFLWMKPLPDGSWYRE
ncbi:polysaccharide deacetylase [Thiohalophilus thiocyanatoxydans]|uniref:Polysaccharide deacetylase n=2 Tax=Thiohalophilus thiocyanatoxydans TaxID=381308 RepID=A0A4R8IPT8_9GAMM|nr:polysaccharide deacetylase [Thiohalophilus thiocyanatoxydans]